VDSVSDPSADDLLRHLYDLTFRQPSSWGWIVAGLFAAGPAWLAIVCMIEGNVVGSAVFLLMTGIVPALRYFLLRRGGYAPFGRFHIPANDG
jgi:hypothetical protein